MKNRENINEQYKWKLEDIYENIQAWEQDFKTLSGSIDSLAKYKGKLNNADTLYECFKNSDKIEQLFSRLYIYAHLKQDEDTANSKAKGYAQRISMLGVSLSNESSYISPELLSYPDSYLKSLLSDARFSDYSYSLSELVRTKQHILTEKEENILSAVGLFSDGFHDTFTMLDNADISFKKIKDEEGKLSDMSHGAYSVFLQSPDAKVRKRAFESMFDAYQKQINTIAANYTGSLKKDWFYAKVRGYNDCLEYALDGENVSRVVYDKLIDNVGANLKVLHKYVAYRKKALNLSTLNMYDMYLPLVDGTNLKLSYDEAVGKVKSALKPLGEDYMAILEQAFSDRWIDVYETKGKRSGAYSWGTYGVHPYVLLNYQPTTNDIFTIAHELGHALHSYKSNHNQPFAKADYVIFVAEIASTVNEVLLLKNMLLDAPSDLKKSLLSYYMDMFRTTLFRQTMFAEFEKVAHGMVEGGEPPSADSLNEAYYELNKKYYGKSVRHNDLIKYEWARIPHFYRGFYVYKYATGLITAVNIAGNILAGKKGAVEGYMQFLSAGGSMPPTDIVKLAGVDLLTDEPYEYAFNEFNNTLKELESL